MLPAPRLGSDQRGGTFPDLVGRHEFPTPEELDFRDIANRPLIADRESGESIDLVAPKINPDGLERCGRKHVDDRSAHRHFTAMFNLELPAVPHVHELFDELGLIDRIAMTDADRLSLFDVWAQPLKQCSNGCNDDRWGVVRVL